MALRKGNDVKPTAEAMQESIQAAQQAPVEQPPFDIDGEATVVEPEPAAPAAPETPAAQQPRQPEAVTAPEAQHDQQAYQQTQVGQAPAQELAPRPSTPTAMAPASGTAAAINTSLAEAGFEGLQLGFGAFPIIVLTNAGRFETSDGEDLGNYFYAVLLGSKQKFIYKNNMSGKDEDFFYSYDNVNSTNGIPVAELLKAWQAKGWKHEIKPYLDVQCIVVDEPDLSPEAGEMAILSIPKTSIARFSGYIWTQQAKGNSPGTYVTKCLVGDKVTKVAYPFNPWSFDFARSL